MERRYCVYRHTNKSNGKVYIGITSQPPRKRWDCGRGYIQNKHFWNAIQKYGWDGFDHDVLVTNLSPEKAFSLEKELIVKYDARNYERGYNCSPGGEGGNGLFGENHPMYGKHHSEETRAKLSASHKGVPYSPERYARFLDAMNREKMREIAYRTIVGYNKGKHHSEEHKRKIAESNRGQQRTDITKMRISEAMKKPVLQLSKDGLLIREWDSAKTASLQSGICASHISGVCKGKRKTAGGFVWRYKD